MLLVVNMGHKEVMFDLDSSEVTSASCPCLSSGIWQNLMGSWVGLHDTFNSRVYTKVLLPATNFTLGEGLIRYEKSSKLLSLLSETTVKAMNADVYENRTRA